MIISSSGATQSVTTRAPGYTKDIDLWIDSNPANLERVYRALARFGAPQSVLNDLQSLAPDEFLFFGHPPVRVDLLQTIPGLDFRTSFARRLDVDWEGVPVKLVSREDLIHAKKAAGRPQDLIDIGELERFHPR